MGPSFYSSIYTLWRDALRSSASGPVKAGGGSDDIGCKTNIISRCLRSNFSCHIMCKERTTTCLKVQMLITLPINIVAMRTFSLPNQSEFFLWTTNFSSWEAITNLINLYDVVYIVC